MFSFFFLVVFVPFFCRGGVLISGNDAWAWPASGGVFCLWLWARPRVRGSSPKCLGLPGFWHQGSKDFGVFESISDLSDRGLGSLPNVNPG